MNSRTFRRNHGTKPKSASSTFISLHFNKADEDQLEISYKDDKKTKDVMSKSVSEGPQSNLTLYIPETKKDTSHVSELHKNDSTSNDFFDKDHLECRNKGTNLSCAEDVLEESVEGNVPDTVGRLKCCESAMVNENDSLKNGQNEDIESEISVTDYSNVGFNDSQFKLSPAIEAAELEDSDSFNHYINDELAKGKCEILDMKKEMASSFRALTHSNKDLKDAVSVFNSQTDSAKTVDVSIQPKSITKKLHKDRSQFYNFLQECVDLLKCARNSVKFHIFIAVFACLCVPIPTWISGFLVGVILSSSLVYWLYKPPKMKKNAHNFVSTQSTQISKLQEKSGMLKGWMNELPSFMSYNPDKYHVTYTRSVYVRLDGSYLRFSFPQKNISKRAMFNEPRHEMQFVYQQHYDIADAAVELLPKGLTNKRLWSKKYPICLKIPNSKEAVLTNSSKIDAVDAPFSLKSNRKENSSKKFLPRITENNEIVIYLFARTDRDKNLWYYRFQRASRIKLGRSHSPTLSTIFTENDSLENKRTLSLDFAFLQSGSSLQSEQCFLKGEDETDDGFVEINLNKYQKFEMYMSALWSPLHVEHPFGLQKKDKGTKSGLTWLNVLIGRLFFDFLIEDAWAQLVTEKIQRKLNKLKLPFFLTELIVKDINLGSALPKIHQASDPSIDERGLWIDIDLSYNGSFHMTLETKLNLRKFKADSEEFWNSLSEVSKQNEASEQLTKSPAYNSDEDSMESSSDDESPFPEVNEDISAKDSSLPISSGSTSKKFFNFVNRLAQSPYFQHAAKNKYIKRAMDDLSNTPLVLTVEVQWLTGTLAVNIPPWPTDRLWYGFRTNPSLSITARPKLGQHVVTFTQVTEWIEKKLVSEFQKLLVMPNMDDLIIPIMQSCPDIPQT